MERHNCKVKMKSQKEKTVLLPQELVVEILLRLPVKSLVRFKSACKSLLSLISSPHFAKSHFELAAAPTERIVLLDPCVTEIQSIDYNASLYDDSASVMLNNEFMASHSYVEIQGSCRGFLLLDLYDVLCLWNPSTGVHKSVERSPAVSSIDNDELSLFLTGFGYDPSRDDYLVVLAFKNYDEIDEYWDRSEFRVKYFSLRADVWEEIEVTHLSYSLFSHSIVYNQAGTLLNGVIHWLAFNHDKQMDVIVAFDLTEISFSEITMPFFEDDDIVVGYLRVCGELLSLCVQGDDNSSLKIWVMQEYRVQSSWAKTIVVSFHDIPIQLFSLICSTKSGDIIGNDDVYKDTLTKCNDKGQLKEHRSYCDNPCTSRAAAAYTESLLSLPTGESKKMTNK